VVAVNQGLQRLLRDQPDVLHAVVIVLALGSEDTSPDSLGLTDCEPIPYQNGMFKATMTGADLLRLAEFTEVEEITLDEEVTAL